MNKPTLADAPHSFWRNPILVSGLVSALISAIVSVYFSNYLNQRHDRYNKKLEVVATLAAYRFDITGEKFIEELNKAFVIFSGSEEVIRTLKAFHDQTLEQHRSNELANQKLLDLFKAMCRDVDIEITSLNDNYFLMPFNARK